MSDVTEKTVHDIPVSMTVGASGKLLVLTAAGNMWEWSSKERRWGRMQPVPLTMAWDEYMQQAMQGPAQEQGQSDDKPGEPEKAQEA
jgi:hypothetical protein